MKALILAGDGINCEKETAACAREGGFEVQIEHVNDLLAKGGKPLFSSRLMVVPGGFSFGDELGSGQVLALKLRHGLGSALTQWIRDGGSVLGICNGFQVLTRLGVFGDRVSLAHNQHGKFINRWVGLRIRGSSIFTDGLRERGVTRLELPIRHGEGCFSVSGAAGLLPDFEPTLSYEEDVNGSWENIAGVSAFEGRVFGLMPHPEAFWTPELHPWSSGKHLPLGQELFQSARKRIRP